MELSIDKTKITDVKEGFDFLGYRVVQTKARNTGRRVGNLFIPKSKLNDLRYKIKVMVRGTTNGSTLASLIIKLNPILVGMEELLSVRHRRIPGVPSPRLLDMGARRALAEEEARRRVVAGAATPLPSQRPGKAATVDRRVQTTAVPLRRRDPPLPDPENRETERMECAPDRPTAQSHAGLPGRILAPQTRLRPTHGRAIVHAWRAGCEETRTSGSERGMEKLVSVRG